MLCLSCDYSGQSCGANEYPSSCVDGQDTSAAPCLSCPTDSSVDAGVATSVDDCTCKDGMYMSTAKTCEYHTCLKGFYNDVTSGACEQCPANSYCEAYKGVQACPANSFSWAESDELSDCTCNAGFSAYTHEDGSLQCITDCASGEFFDFDLGICATCPANYFCDTVTKRYCGLNSVSDAGSTVFSDCKCVDSYYGPVLASCVECPEETWSSSLTMPPGYSGEPTTIDVCMCAPGTFGDVVDGVANCVDCTIGNYCPGDGTEHACPNNQVTFPNTGQSSETSCTVPVCGNGILEGSEQCDDGERFDGDGCNGYCQFEDSSGTAEGVFYFFFIFL